MKQGKNKITSKQLAGRPVAVITLSRWVEGLGLAPENPKQIRSVDDLARPDVTLVNREPGSGSRLLLDTALQAAGLDPAALPGYERELPGHRPVAEALANGLADAGPLAARHGHPLYLYVESST